MTAVLGEGAIVAERSEPMSRLGLELMLATITNDWAGDKARCQAWDAIVESHSELARRNQEMVDQLEASSDAIVRMSCFYERHLVIAGLRERALQRQLRTERAEVARLGEALEYQHTIGDRLRRLLRGRR